MSRQKSNAFASLEKEIESQKQKIVDFEHKNIEKSSSISKLNESLNMVVKKKEKTLMLHEESHKELQQIKVMNSNMNCDLRCIKKEHDKITMELEESNNLNDLQQTYFAKKIHKAQKKQLYAKIVLLEKQLKSKENLEMEVQELKGKLEVKKQMEDEFLKMVGALQVKLMKKEQELKDSEEFNQSSVIKELESNDELQKARKKLIEGIAESSSPSANIGVKRMGELDPSIFLTSLRAKKNYNKEKIPKSALEECSLWQSYLEDPHWHPFKIITNDGKPQAEMIDEQDAKLDRLRWEWGNGAYRAVVAALREMNEYNNPISAELWNYREGRKATLEEGIEFLLSQRETKKRKTHQTDQVIVPWMHGGYNFITL